jgi:hypothetical protein
MAITADTSKINAYAVLDTNGPGASKIVAYAVLEGGTQASKINAYAVLQTTLSGDISEAASAAAAIDATSTGNTGTLSESATAVDAAASTATWPASITEAATASDATDAAYNLVVEISEPASATDALDATSTGNTRALVEPASATDAPDATSTGNTRDLSEAAAAIDWINAIFLASHSPPAPAALLTANAPISEYSYTQGTGSYTVAGAWGGRLPFSALYGAGSSVIYKATDGSANSEWAIGTYDAVAKTLSRTLIIASTNGGHPVNWSGRTRLIMTPLCECGTSTIPPPPPGNNLIEPATASDSIDATTTGPIPPPVPPTIVTTVAVGSYVTSENQTRSIIVTTTHPNEIIVLKVSTQAEAGPAPTVSSIDDGTLVWAKRSAVSGNTRLGFYGDVEVWWALAPTPITVTINVTVVSATAWIILLAARFVGIHLGAPWDTNPSLPAIASNLVGAPAAQPQVSGFSTDAANGVALFFYDDYFGATTVSATGSIPLTFAVGFSLIQAFIGLGNDSEIFDAITTSPLVSATFTGHPTSALGAPINGWIVIADALQAA